MQDIAKLRLENLSMTFPDKTGSRKAGLQRDFVALAPIDLAIPAGRFVSLIGPSGCGKSTIFNIVAGLQPPTTGRVLIDGEDATGLIGQVGYMLQKDMLLPWRTVLDNVVLGMEIRGEPMAAARARALPLLHRYGLGGFENKYPGTLSGGMRQRAALLRTLLVDIDVVLLDEPFGALDAQTKSQMQEWLLRLFHDFGRTVVFVTHDVEEAIFLSDEIHVMASRPGRIVETLPIDLPRPRDRSIVSEPRFRGDEKVLPRSVARTGGYLDRCRIASGAWRRGRNPCLPTRRPWPMSLHGPTQ